MTLKLEVGKKYRNLKGEVITVKGFAYAPVRFAYQGDNDYFYDCDGICAFSALPRLIEEVIEEPVKKPHKHAELIKAWADGAEIEYRVGQRWFGMNGCPRWADVTEYRIKPEPKPDVTNYLVNMKPSGWLEYSSYCGSISYEKIKIIRDGITGELKDAEVLR